MKRKTSELTGAALDWAVAKCEGLTLYEDAMLDGLLKRGWWVSGMSIDPNTWHPLSRFNLSTDWAEGGPIIEREGIVPALARNKKFYVAWKGCASDFGMVPHLTGPTPLTAAMRCYVASKLGDEVEVPDGLL